MQAGMHDVCIYLITRIEDLQINVIGIEQANQFR